MIPLTADALEQIAFDTGATIHMWHNRATLSLGADVYVAALADRDEGES